MEGNENAPKQEKERANQNNTNNIRNAADVAIASKNPYAMAAGGAVKLADKVSGGRASEKLGKTMTRLNRHSPMGKKMQSASNKLSESGASDAIGKAAAAKNGMSGNGAQSLDSVKGGANGSPQVSNAGQDRLKSSLSNKMKNYVNKRKKKKNDNNEDTEKKEEESKEEDNEDDDKEEKAKIKKAQKIKITIYIALALLAVFAVIVLIAVIAVLISGIFGILSRIILGPSDEELKDENMRDYYQLVKNVNNKFKEQCKTGNEEIPDLKVEYINAILVYAAFLDNSDKSEDNSADNNELSWVDYSGMYNLLYEMVYYDNIFNDLQCNVNYDKHEQEPSCANGSVTDSLYDILYCSPIVFRRYELYIDTKIGGENSYKKLFDEAWDLAENMISIDDDEPEAIPNSFAIQIPEQKKDILVKDYLAGVVYANMNQSDLTNSEKIKAYTVAYTTNILSKNNITVNTQSISADSIKDIVYCDPSSECNGKGAMSDIIKNTVNNSINSVYGNVLVNSNGKYDTLDISKLNNASGHDYKNILLNAYENYTIIDAKEDVYDNGVNYGNEKVLTETIFYEQKDYNEKFCGIKNETIGSSGCGTTAMSIVVSTYEKDNKYNPSYMMNEAYKKGYCGSGISGTRPGFFKYEADKMGYRHIKTRKTTDELNLITYHLRQGHLVIVNVLSGHFTSSGHYIVLGGIDPATKKVYVYDPNNRNNSKYRSTGNGWYSFNDIIVKEAKGKPEYGFYIIWKE